MRYRVTSKHPVLEHAPGDEFDAEPSVQVSRLIASGALEIVADEPAPEE